jgi:2-dehydro-3-deoxyphosphooctonate aldolase (KDO 8-P synthase)
MTTGAAGLTGPTRRTDDAQTLRSWLSRAVRFAKVAVLSSSPAVTPAVIGPYTVGPGRPLLLIAGPCVLESEKLALSIAETLARETAGLPVSLVFKASFDKANRTSGAAFRGMGVEKGLALLAKIRGATGLPVTTDVHETDQATAAGEVVDLLQIPAFLAR